MANPFSSPTELIHRLPWKRIEPAPGEILDIFRVATFEQGGVGLVRLNSGVYRSHVHGNVDSGITIIEGNGLFLLEGDTFDYNPGSRIYVPRRSSHGLGVFSPTLLFTVQDGEIYQNGKLDFRYT